VVSSTTQRDDGYVAVTIDQLQTPPAATLPEMSEAT
jgi:hypothetical protein